MSRDAYSYWRDALAGVFGEVHDGDPQPGFYRTRFAKSAPWLPVAIWAEDGRVLCDVNGGSVDPDEPGCAAPSTRSRRPTTVPASPRARGRAK